MALLRRIADAPVRASFDHSRSSSLKSEWNAIAIMDILPISASKSIGAIIKVFMTMLPVIYGRHYVVAMIVQEMTILSGFKIRQPLQFFVARNTGAWKYDPIRSDQQDFGSPPAEAFARGLQVPRCTAALRSPVAIPGKSLTQLGRSPNRSPCRANDLWPIRCRAIRPNMPVV
jgi:hypothetical protein